MDMLASNAFSISNPTPWPTIWVKPIYLCLITKNHAFPIINGPILILLSKPQACENMFMTQNWLPLLHLCTTPTSLKARLIVMSDNILLVSNRSCLVVAYVVPSQPSVTKVTQCMPLLTVFKKLWTPFLFVFQSCPLYPSLDALQKIGSCPLKWQLCE
jgi:hypothetical protein